MEYFAEDGASFTTCRYMLERLNLDINPRVNNSFNYGAVLNSLVKISSDKKRNSKYIGFVDDDKMKHSFEKEFSICVEERNGVTVLRNKKLYLIRTSPAIDKFLFDNANEVELDFSKYKLNNSFSHFKKQLKNQQIKSSSDFKNLLNDLHQKRASCFVALQEAFNFVQGVK